MKNILSLFILFLRLSLPLDSTAQMNNKWIMGYNLAGTINPYLSVFTLDFRTGNIVYDTMHALKYSFLSNNASICDSTGELLFYTNGFAVMNAMHDTMMNGDALNPAPLGSDGWAIVGMPWSQMSIIIPDPGSYYKYYIIHHAYYNIVQLPNLFCDTLFYSIVDMSLDSGRGAVSVKNQPLWIGDAFASDVINLTCLTACKHANGRDWWIVTHKDSTNIFMTFLLTPDGFSGPYLQNIGPVIFQGGTQACFSPDGNKYCIMYHNNPHIFDFDRCTGTFSHHKNLGPFNISTGGSAGIVISPSSQYIYASLSTKMYQWDLNAANVKSTQTLVCEYDSINPCPSYLVSFYLMQAAIDGKIYISSPNSSNCMSVINNPDSAGLACNAMARGLSTMPFYNGSSVPYYPNFYLGPETGSICDSLTAVSENVDFSMSLSVYPNPGNGVFRITYQMPHGEPGIMGLFNSLGQCVYTHPLSPWSRVHEVDISLEPSGLYYCLVRSDSCQGSIKIVKE